MDDFFAAMSITEVVDDIAAIHRRIRDFWGNAQGWASVDAAQLLSQARLDWQVALSGCLHIWIDPATDGDDGRLILAYANLGSLMEGVMKLFLSVYYENYRVDVDAIRDRKGKLVDPDESALEMLRQFFVSKDLFPEFHTWVQQVQQRRNAIHSFRSRAIGTYAEYIEDVRQYLRFLQAIDARLPYP